jgi:hypothetical protein
MTAKYPLAVNSLLPAPVHIFIVGCRTKESAQALLSAALRAFRPGKTVQVLDPAGNRPQLEELYYPSQSVAA